MRKDALTPFLALLFQKRKKDRSTLRASTRKMGQFFMRKIFKLFEKNKKA